MTNGEKLGNKLYELRKKAGLSQEELAEKLSVSRQAVSKWECGESLPDTEKLIAISKFYSVSLDGLVGNEPTKTDLVQERVIQEEPAPVQASNEKQTLNAEEEEPTLEEEEENDEDEEEDEAWKNKSLGARILYTFPSPIIVTIAFLLWGFVWGGWGVGWTLYLLIPVYHSVIECIKKKKWSAFAYPVLISFIYLFMGMQWGLWHPYWVLYITVPIYYAIASAIDKE